MARVHMMAPLLLTIETYEQTIDNMKSTKPVNWGKYFSLFTSVSYYFSKWTIAIAIAIAIDNKVLCSQWRFRSDTRRRLTKKIALDSLQKYTAFKLTMQYIRRGGL